MALLMKVGETHPIDIKPANKDFFTLEELQSYVDGYIEIIHVKGKLYTQLIVNDEGRINGSPVNEMATYYVTNILGLSHIVHGDCVLATPKEIT